MSDPTLEQNFAQMSRAVVERLDRAELIGQIYDRAPKAYPDLRGYDTTKTLLTRLATVRTVLRTTPKTTVAFRRLNMERRLVQCKLATYGPDSAGSRHALSVTEMFWNDVHADNNLRRKHTLILLELMLAGKDNEALARCVQK